MQAQDHNPYLKRSHRPEPDQAGGAGEIERPGHIRNVAWQTRSAPPSEYENHLGDALEKVFAAGIEDAAGVARKLNELGLRAPDGAAWTEQSFQDEIRRLAAK